MTLSTFFFSHASRAVRKQSPLQPCMASFDQGIFFRSKSSSTVEYPLSEDGDVPNKPSEYISFPSSNVESKPVLLNAREHVVGYLSKILNARVYDVAIETELQEAKNLSAVSRRIAIYSYYYMSDC